MLFPRGNSIMWLSYSHVEVQSSDFLIPMWKFNHVTFLSPRGNSIMWLSYSPRVFFLQKYCGPPVQRTRGHFQPDSMVGLSHLLVPEETPQISTGDFHEQTGRRHMLGGTEGHLRTQGVGARNDSQVNHVFLYPTCSTVTWSNSFRLWRYGRWQKVFIDDRLPQKNGEYCYARSVYT